LKSSQSQSLAGILAASAASAASSSREADPLYQKLVALLGLARSGRMSDDPVAVMRKLVAALPEVLQGLRDKPGMQQEFITTGEELLAEGQRILALADGEASEQESPVVISFRKFGGASLVSEANGKAFTINVHENGDILAKFDDGTIEDLFPNWADEDAHARMEFFMEGSAYEIGNKAWEAFDPATGLALTAVNDDGTFKGVGLEFGNGKLRRIDSREEFDASSGVDLGAKTSAPVTGNEPQPSPDSKIVLAFRGAGGDFLDKDTGRTYYFEIRDDGHVWGRFNDGQVLSLTQADKFPTTSADIEDNLNAFLELSTLQVALGAWTMFDVASGEDIPTDQFPMVFFDGTTLNVGYGEDRGRVEALAQIRAAADNKKLVYRGAGLGTELAQMEVQHFAV
jgi:hypothetical protein